MDNKELFIIMGFIKSSNHRLMTLKAIENSIKTPAEIGREIDLRTTQVSSALIELKKKKLVVCLNEDARKGRLYTSSELGKEILKEYDTLFNSKQHNEQ